MFSARNQLIEYLERGVIPADKLTDALISARITPDSKAWRLFIDHLLLWSGTLSLAFSVMFFIAYNWGDIGRFAKFALVESCIVLSILAYCRLTQHEIAAKASLFMASIFLGVLLALYGQTYQTGADPWQLFFNWALLMLPWAIIGRFAAIWILWVLLINLSLALYYQTFWGIFGIVFSAETTLFWLLFLFNSCCLFAWEMLSRKWPWLDTRWAVRTLAIASGLPITLLVLYSLFDSRDATGLSMLVWPLWLAMMFTVYQHKKRDLFMLAEACLSGIVVVVSFLSKNVLDDNFAGGFLFLALVVIGLGTGAAVWLRKIHREWQA